VSDDDNGERRDNTRHRQGESREVSDLRETVVQLRIGKAETDVLLDQLMKNVSELTVMVGSLKATIDTSRGALWVIGGVAGALGAASGLLGSLLLRR
jgi:hypothetical protein